MIPHLDARQPQRRPAPVRPRRAALHLHRGRRRRPPQNTPEPDQPARKAPADQSARRRPGSSTRSRRTIPSPAAPAGADEIYSYGLRNPYRFSFDRLTGDLIDRRRRRRAAGRRSTSCPRAPARGVNFGWDCFEGTATAPRRAASAAPRCATTSRRCTSTRTRAAERRAAINGGYVVRDTALPSLLGRYLYADSFGRVPGDPLHHPLLRRIERRREHRADGRNRVVRPGRLRPRLRRALQRRGEPDPGRTRGRRLRSASSPATGSHPH